MIPWTRNNIFLATCLIFIVVSFVDTKKDKPNKEPKQNGSGQKNNVDASNWNNLGIQDSSIGKSGEKPGFTWNEYQGSNWNSKELKGKKNKNKKDGKSGENKNSNWSENPSLNDMWATYGSNWNNPGAKEPKWMKNGKSGELQDFIYNDYQGSNWNSKELKGKNGKKQKGGKIDKNQDSVYNEYFGSNGAEYGVGNPLINWNNKLANGQTNDYVRQYQTPVAEDFSGLQNANDETNGSVSESSLISNWSNWLNQIISGTNDTSLVDSPNNSLIKDFGSNVDNLESPNISYSGLRGEYLQNNLQQNDSNVDNWFGGNAQYQNDVEASNWLNPSNDFQQPHQSDIGSNNYSPDSWTSLLNQWFSIQNNTSQNNVDHVYSETDISTNSADNKHVSVLANLLPSSTAASLPSSSNIAIEDVQRTTDDISVQFWKYLSNQWFPDSNRTSPMPVYQTNSDNEYASFDSASNSATYEANYLNQSDTQPKTNKAISEENNTDESDSYSLNYLSNWLSQLLYGYNGTQSGESTNSKDEQFVNSANNDKSDYDYQNNSSTGYNSDLSLEFWTNLLNQWLYGKSNEDLGYIESNQDEFSGLSMDGNIGQSHIFIYKNKVARKDIDSNDNLSNNLKYWLKQIYQANDKVDTKNENNLVGDNTRENLNKIYEVEYETVARVIYPSAEIEHQHEILQNDVCDKINEYSVSLIFNNSFDTERISIIHFGMHNNRQDMYQDFQFSRNTLHNKFYSFGLSLQFNISLANDFGAIEKFELNLQGDNPFYNTDEISLSHIIIINNYYSCELQYILPSNMIIRINETYVDVIDNRNCINHQQTDFTPQNPVMTILPNTATILPNTVVSESLTNNSNVIYVEYSSTPPSKTVIKNNEHAQGMSNVSVDINRNTQPLDTANQINQATTSKSTDYSGGNQNTPSTNNVYEIIETMTKSNMGTGKYKSTPQPDTVEKNSKITSKMIIGESDENYRTTLSDTNNSNTGATTLRSNVIAVENKSTSPSGTVIEINYVTTSSTEENGGNYNTSSSDNVYENIETKTKSSMRTNKYKSTTLSDTVVAVNTKSPNKNSDENFSTPPPYTLGKNSKITSKMTIDESDENYSTSLSHTISSNTGATTIRSNVIAVENKNTPPSVNVIEFNNVTTGRSTAESTENERPSLSGSLNKSTTRSNVKTEGNKNITPLENTNKNTELTTSRSTEKSDESTFQFGIVRNNHISTTQSNVITRENGSTPLSGIVTENPLETTKSTKESSEKYITPKLDTVDSSIAATMKWSHTGRNTVENESTPSSNNIIQNKDTSKIWSTEESDENNSATTRSNLIAVGDLRTTLSGNVIEMNELTTRRSTDENKNSSPTYEYDVNNNNKTSTKFNTIIGENQSTSPSSAISEDTTNSLPLASHWMPNITSFIPIVTVTNVQASVYTTEDSATPNSINRVFTDSAPIDIADHVLGWEDIIMTTEPINSSPSDKKPGYIIYFVNFNTGDNLSMGSQTLVTLIGVDKQNLSPKYFILKRIIALAPNTNVTFEFSVPRSYGNITEFYLKLGDEHIILNNIWNVEAINNEKLNNLYSKLKMSSNYQIVSTIDSALPNIKGVIFERIYPITDNPSEFSNKHLQDLPGVSTRPNHDSYQITFAMGNQNYTNNECGLYFTMNNRNNVSSEIFKFKPKSGRCWPNQNSSAEIHLPSRFGKITVFKIWLAPEMTSGWLLESVMIMNIATGEKQFEIVNAYLKPNYVLSYDVNTFASLYIPNSESKLQNNSKPLANNEYIITFEIGDEIEAESENAVYLTLFNKQTMSTEEFQFLPKNGKFKKSQKYSFKFAIPIDFGAITEYQIKLDNNTIDNLSLKTIHVANSKTQIHQTKEIGRLLDAGSMLRVKFNSDPYTIYNPHDSRFRKNAYVVIFESGKEMSEKFEGKVYFTVFNEANITSKEFKFDRTSGEYLGDHKESFEFYVPNNFGNISNIQIMYDNKKANHNWKLESVTLINQNTDRSQYRKIAATLSPNSKFNFKLDPHSTDNGSPEKTDEPLKEDATFEPVTDDAILKNNNRGNKNHIFKVTLQTPHSTSQTNLDGPDYIVIFTMGNESVASSINSIIFTVFDDKDHSNNYSFVPKDGKFAPRSSQPFFFTVPKMFGNVSRFQIQVDTSNSDLNPNDNFKLESATIVNMQSGRQWAMPIANENNNDNFSTQDWDEIQAYTTIKDLIDNPTPTEDTSTFNPTQTSTDDYTVTFNTSGSSDMDINKIIYFSVLNTRNETSPEFKFTLKAQLGPIAVETTDSFQIKLVQSFGEISGFRLRIGNYSTKQQWNLTSVTITSTKTGSSTHTKIATGSIHEGNPYIAQLPPADIQNGSDYEVIFQTENSQDDGSINSIIFTAFDDQNVGSKNFSFTPKSGEFLPGSNQSFYFRVPMSFGNVNRFQIHIDTNSPNYNPNDNWKLESITIINMQSGHQWTTSIGKYMFANENDDDKVSTNGWNEISTFSSIMSTQGRSLEHETITEDTPTFPVISPTESNTEDYTVMFNTNGASDINKTIYFSVLNARNETSPEFKFTPKAGTLPAGSKDSFQFKLIKSFGEIAGFQLRIGNYSTKQQWYLTSVTITSKKTGISTNTKIATGSIQEGNQYIVRLPPADIQDGPDYEVIFQTGNAQDDGSINSILFTAFDDQNVGTTNFSFAPKGGEFLQGSNQSFYFRVPMKFGNVNRFQIQIDTNSPNYNPNDNWKLESVTIINMQSGRQWTTSIGKYMFANYNDKDSTQDWRTITPFSSTITTESPLNFTYVNQNRNTITIPGIRGTPSNTDDYTVTFDTREESDMNKNSTIYFKVVNDRNETSPEFLFKRVGSLMSGMQESFNFKVLHSFGEIVGFQLRLANVSSVKKWHLNSVTVTSLTTGDARKTIVPNGYILGGYQFTFRLIVVPSQDGPNYRVIIQTGNGSEDGSTNPVLFRAFDDQMVNSMNFSFIPKGGVFAPGSNQSFEFSVPKSFGNVKSFQIAIDTNNSLFNPDDNWKLESVSVVNEKSGRQWTKQVNQYMLASGDNNKDEYTSEDWSQYSNIGSTITRGKQSDLQITYTCNGETKFKELEANDYLVTLQLGNLNDLSTNETIYFSAIGDKNESTDPIKHVFTSDDLATTKFVSFNFSVPHGFGPILKFVLHSVGNVDPINLHSVQIVNLVSGRKQIQSMDDSLTSNKSKTYEIEAITCDEVANNQQPTKPNGNMNNDESSVQVTFTCNGVTAFTETDSNDYRVTLQLNNVKDPNVFIYFAAISSGNQTTDSTKYTLNGQNSVEVAFNLSVSRGFGPILKFRMHTEGNVNPIDLNFIDILNLDSGRQQIKYMNDSLVHGKDYVFDIEPITCNPMTATNNYLSSSIALI